MLSLEKRNIILGIDPGTTIMGYGVIEVTGKKAHAITLGVINLKKIDNHYEKIGHIFTRTQGLIDEYKPEVMAIESPFYGKNVQSMLKLGRAQGVAIAAALSRNIPIYEYAPRKIKMSITGQGAASKEQVAFMLKSLLGLKELPADLDATDGLAAAFCHFLQMGKPATSARAGSWKEFIRSHPGRVSSRG
jgi:crossover junction endodeoxyribonuclease RuvC